MSLACRVQQQDQQHKGRSAQQGGSRPPATAQSDGRTGKKKKKKVQLEWRLVTTCLVISLLVPVIVNIGLRNSCGVAAFTAYDCQNKTNKVEPGTAAPAAIGGSGQNW